MNVQLTFGLIPKAGLCAIVFLFSSVFGFSQQKNWYTHKDTLNNFIVDFPAAPAKKQVNKGFSVEFEYNDKTNGILYTSTALYTGPIVGGTVDQYLNETLNKYTEGEQVKLQYKKKLGNDTLAKLEAGLKKDNKFIRVIYYFKNEVFYSLSAESATDNLSEDGTEHFFSSFKITAPAIAKTNTWVAYKNAAGAFRVSLPTSPQETKNEVENKAFPDYPSYVLNLIMATDKAKKVNYIIRYNDFPAGTYMLSKIITFNELIKDLETKGKITGSPRVISKDGYEGRSILLSAQGTLLEIEVYIRGNRIYLLMRQNMNENVMEPVQDDFFNSFHFEKYVPAEGVLFAKDKVSARLPSEPFLVTDADNNYKSIMKNSKPYYMVNANSGGVYGLHYGTLSKYLRIKNIDSAYQNIFTSLKAGEGSNYTSSDILVDQVKGKEYYAVDTVAGTNRKIRVFINNDQFYFQSAILSEEEMSSNQAADFFNSLKFGVHPAFDLQGSKAALIFEDSKSADSVTRSGALGAFSYYEFDKEELPLIYNALKLKRTDDTTHNGARSLLIRELVKLNDDRTVPLLKELFQDALNTDVIKAEVLPAVVAVDKNSYDWYFNALVTGTPLKLKEYWDIFQPLNDSVSYAAANLDRLLTLIDSDEYRLNVIDVVTTLLNEDHKADYAAVVGNRKEKIASKAMQDLDTYISKLYSMYPSAVSRYLYILPEIKMPGLTDEFTKKVFAIDSVPFLHTAAFVARIKADLPLDPKMLAAQLDSLSSRYEIMYAFNKKGKLESVPVKYRKHEEFARLILYGYLTDDYDTPNSISLLGKVVDGKDIYYAFEFTYIEDEVVKTYVGICGTFDNQSGKLKFEGYACHTKYEEKTADWLKQAKALIAEMK